MDIEEINLQPVCEVPRCSHWSDLKTKQTFILILSYMQDIQIDILFGIDFDIVLGIY